MKPPTKTSFQMAIGCLIAVIGILAYSYAYIKVEALDNAVSIERSTILASSVSNQSASDATEILATTTSDRAALASEFVPALGAAEAIDTLENLGRALGLSIDTVSVNQAPNPQDSTNPPISQQLLITISTEGSWSENATYLAELENLPYFSFITKYSLDEDGTAADIWDGSIDIVLIQLN
jgi:hypothetical protein